MVYVVIFAELITPQENMSKKLIVLMDFVKHGQHVINVELQKNTWHQAAQMKTRPTRNYAKSA
jgi:hypothetical protein